MKIQGAIEKADKVAEKAAAKRRKNGFKVRITKEHATGSGKGETYRWVVWSRL